MAAMKRRVRQSEMVTQERAPRTRLGGAITFRGKQYSTEAELALALVSAVEEAGAGDVRWRCIPKDEAYAQALRDVRGAVV